MQKILLTSSNRKCDNPNVFLGYEGENQANTLVFEFTDGFRDGLGVLNLKRGDEYGYVSLDKVDETYQFPVKNAILTKTGEINFQVVITGEDGAVIKYDPFVMVVKDAIDADTEMPEDYPSWVDMANSKLAEVDEAITNVEQVANSLIQAKENGEFDGKDGINGKDGISPRVATQQTSDGAIITITDAEGTHTANVYNGKDGKDGTLTFEELTEEQKATLKGEQGEKGADGFSPIANVTQIDDGATISITDKKGTNTATVRNGKDGVNGKDGANGITPHIGANGNWWIGETDTGVKAEGTGGGIAELPIASTETLGGIKVGEGLEITEDGVLSALGGGSGKVTTLWEGVLTNGQKATLLDTYKNYDFLLVQGCCYVNGVRALIETRIIPTNQIKYIENDLTNSYNIYSANNNNNTSGGYYRLFFGFENDTTLTLPVTAVGVWNNPQINYIIGIKLGGSSSSEEIYSTDEQRIGTWIDGKPLYRKVYKFDITATSTRQNIVFDKGFATNKILKNIGGNVISKDYSGFQFHLGLFNWHNSTNQFFMFLPCVDNNDLKLEVQWSVTQDFIVEAVIEYTKTTD